ncbi:MAG: dual specificity protein phosphatase family protein [Waddliaceae bacterium]
MTSNTLTYLVGELYALSRIPPQTHVHKDRKGSIIPTAGYTLGLQSVADAYKGDSPEQTAQDINAFVKELVQRISEEVEAAQTAGETSFHKKTFRKLVFINQQIHEAIRGKTENGGLLGLYDIYTDEAQQSIWTAIETMKTRGLKALKAMRQHLPEFEHLSEEELSTLATYKYESDSRPFCPEEEYSDEEWEEAIKISASLKMGYVDSYSYYAKYTGGLLFNETLYALNYRNWWDEIGEFENSRLLLGALPLHIGVASFEKRNDLTALKEKGIQAILSVVEVFENNSDGFITAPIKPEDCQRNNIKHLQLPTPDCQTIFLELISRGVEFIQWNLKNGRPTYVHCKAGRGRSALIVMCYLIKYQNLSAQEAFDLVRKNRPQAGFSEEGSEWKTLKTFERLFKA